MSKPKNRVLTASLACLSASALLLVGACKEQDESASKGPAGGTATGMEITLLNVSYDPTRELYVEFNAHSYHIDRGAVAAKYIDAFFQNPNWDEVNLRLQRAEKTSVVLRA